MVLPDIFKTRLDLLLQNEAHIQNEIDSVFEESQGNQNISFSKVAIKLLSYQKVTTQR